MIYSTTITILSDYDPSSVDLSELARDAEIGDSIAISKEIREACKEEILSSGDFFNNEYE